MARVRRLHARPAGRASRSADDLAVAGRLHARATCRPTTARDRRHRRRLHRHPRRATPPPGAGTVLTHADRADGEPVTDLEPYLGAYGHLVALRAGDLAYLHVHPEEPGDRRRAGRSTSRPRSPAPATYRLFLDFQHGGVVRTAAFTVEAGGAPGHALRGGRRSWPLITWARRSSSSIGGMTCASCANRIESKLNKLDGVTATVNYATEKAQGHLRRRRLDRRPGRAPSRQAGLHRRAPAAAGRADAGRGRRRPDPLAAPAADRLAPSSPSRSSRWRWSRRCSSPTGSGSRSRWPRRSWSGAPGRSTGRRWTNLRHGAATMDTLVSLGTLAALRLVALRAVPRHRRRARA